MEEEKIDCPYCPTPRVDAIHIARCFMKEMKKKQFAPRKQSEAFPKFSLAQITKIERIYRTTPLELIEGLWVCTSCGDCKVRVGASSPPKWCPTCKGEVISGTLFVEKIAREKK